MRTTCPERRVGLPLLYRRGHAACCRDLPLREPRILKDDLDTHASAGGDYSIEVMMTAVRSTARTRYGRVCWRMRDYRAMDMADLDDCLGAGKHWVALRRKDDSFLYLDSLSPDAHPRQSPEEEMVDRMLTYPTCAVELLHQYDEAVASGVMTRTARGQMLVLVSSGHVWRNPTGAGAPVRIRAMYIHTHRRHAGFVQRNTGTAAEMRPVSATDTDPRR